MESAEETIQTPIFEIQTYLIQRETQEEYQNCLVCCDVPVDPISCKGCKSLFCIKCAAKWKKTHNQCPKRCSKPWMFEETGDLGIRAMCPYGKNCLPMPPLQWHKHIRDCDHAPEAVLIQRNLRRSNLCKRGHKLRYWDSPYSEFIDKKCSNCTSNSGGFCRQVCSVCTEYYCLQCRPPICTKNRCPKNHKLVLRPLQTLTMGYLCDSCDMAPLSLGVVAYDDYKCNFGVCGRCFNKLPDKFPEDLEPKLNKYSWKCSKEHNLINMAVFESGVCEQCNQMSTLTKECKECSDRPKYCSYCKLPYCNQKVQCWYRHKLKGYKEDMIEIQYQCERCFKKPLYAFDEQCGFGLCKQCLRATASFAQYSQQVIGNFCPCEGQRSISFRDQFTTSKAVCSECHFEKYCPLECGICQKLTCYECRPPQLEEECYKEHPLEKRETQFVCIRCEKSDAVPKICCLHCEYAVCQTCLIQT